MNPIDQLKQERDALKSRREFLLAQTASINDELVSLYDRIKDLSEKIFEDEAIHTAPSGQIGLMLRYDYGESNYKAAKKFFKSHVLSQWVDFTGAYNPSTEQWSIRLMFNDDSKDRLEEIAQYVDELMPHIKEYDGGKLLSLTEPSLSEHQTYRVALIPDGTWELRGYRFGKTVLHKFNSTLDMVEYLQRVYGFKKD